MGRFKPLLPLGSGTVLSECIDLFHASGIERIIVVTGKRHEEVSTAAKQAGALPVYNENFQEGMFSSVLKGLEMLGEDSAGFFMLPVDTPLVRSETVGRLIETFERTDPLVLYPRFNDERGHPTLISRRLLPQILSHTGVGGLRAVLDMCEEGVQDLHVADFGTVHDLDHPSDYELALSLAGAKYPNDEECQQLWTLYSTPSNIIMHCNAVARVAEAMCKRFNSRNGATPLDVALVRGAALTHDIGKGTKRHEAAGAERLHTHGFHAAADIALEHFDVTLSPAEPITEKEIVFLADKLVRGESPIPLEGRYRDKLVLHGNESGAKEAILGRLGRASDLLIRFDREASDSAEQLAYEVLE